MPNEFDQLTNPECLRKECENLLAQVKLHQSQIEQLRKQVANAKIDALEQLISDMFFDETGFIPYKVEYEDVRDYVDYQKATL